MAEDVSLLMKTEGHSHQITRTSPVQRIDPKHWNLIGALRDDDSGKLKECLANVRMNDVIVKGTRDKVMHLATRHNRINCVIYLLQHYRDRIPELLGLMNKSGHTPLHLAINYGRPSAKIVEAIMTASDVSDKTFAALLNKCDRMTCDKCRNSPGTGPDSCHSGYTALHLAVRMNLPEIVRKLRGLVPNPRARDGADELIPLHFAAKFPTSESLAAVLETFYECGTFCVNEASKKGKTALQMCIEHGDADKVRLLLRYGARLVLNGTRSSTGHFANTALHELVEISNRRNKETVNGIYHLIVENAVQWWHNSRYERDSDELDGTQEKDYEDIRQQAMLKLTCDIRHRGMNVLQYAAHHGAQDLLVTILHTENVFRERKNEQSDHYQQDVTHLTPEFMPTRGYFYDDVNFPDVSCLELIVNNDRPSVAVKMLNCKPFSYLVKPYKLMNRFITNAMLIAHLCFMIKFTFDVLPRSRMWLSEKCNATIDRAENETACVGCHDLSSHIFYNYCSRVLFGVYILWPSLNALFTLISVIVRIYFRCNMARKISKMRAFQEEYERTRQSASTDGHSGKPDAIVETKSNDILTIPMAIMDNRSGYGYQSPATTNSNENEPNQTDKNFNKSYSVAETDVIHKSMSCSTYELSYRMSAVYRRCMVLLKKFEYVSSFVIALIFLALVVWCFFEYSTCRSEQLYVVSVAVSLVYGWIYSITFFATFNRLMTLSGIVQHIIVRDMPSFFVLYVFFLAGFALAFHSLAQTADDVPFAITLYTVFLQMVGAESVMGSIRFDDDKSSNGLFSVATFAGCILIMYIFFTTIVLLNLLIAMMNDTYSRLAEQAKQSIDAEEIKLIRNLLVMKRIFRRLTRCCRKPSADESTKPERFIIDEPQDSHDE